MNHDSNRARSLLLWPPQKVETLRFFVESGMHSFKQIGEIMDITKNTAIGKAHRMNLKGPRMTGPKDEGLVSTLNSRLDAIDVFPGFGKCAFLTGERGAFACCAADVPADNVLAPFCAKHQRACWQTAVKATDNATRPMQRARA